jgi:hypothetical protein
MSLSVQAELAELSREVAEAALPRPRGWATPGSAREHLEEEALIAQLSRRQASYNCDEALGAAVAAWGSPNQDAAGIAFFVASSALQAARAAEDAAMHALETYVALNAGPSGLRVVTK